MVGPALELARAERAEPARAPTERLAAVEYVRHLDGSSPGTRVVCGFVPTNCAKLLLKHKSKTFRLGGEEDTRDEDGDEKPPEGMCGDELVAWWRARATVLKIL